ncbi:glycosyltransferase family 2 protein [Pseudoalteromonas sp. A757]|nr:glycosyltransferase family 2 protein [Pseudoalteromonas sp. A757]
MVSPNLSYPFNKPFLYQFLTGVKLMSKVQFSVIIPLYNKSDCIERALQSVAAQKFQAAEIIVVDDGSTDDSVDKVKALNLENLRVIQQANQGVSSARNNGVKHATSDYVAFLDADDEWSPFFLAKVSKLIHRFPEGGLYATRYQKVLDKQKYIDAKIALTSWDPDGYIMNNYFEIAANGDLPFTASSIVLDKCTFTSLGGFPEGEWMGEDQSLYVQIALNSTIVYTPAIESFYYIGITDSACDKAPPSTICPFAERLFIDIHIGKVADCSAKMAEKYIGAHLCDLAKRNIKHRSYRHALRLLAHPAARAKLLHWGIYSLIAGPMSLISR